LGFTPHNIVRLGCETQPLAGETGQVRPFNPTYHNPNDELSIGKVGYELRHPPGRFLAGGFVKFWRLAAKEGDQPTTLLGVLISSVI
jgi:hypothetical protein